MKKHLISTLILFSLYANAGEVTFSKIQSPKAFQKYWQMSDQAMQKFETYMQVAGKYRHANSNPLVVMSIISESPEDKAFYAGKAAAYESSMAQKEIESAWLITKEMEKQGLEDTLQRFSDKLTGIDTMSYKPGDKYLKTASFNDSDEVMLVIDQVCFDANCIQQFMKKADELPAMVKRSVVLKSGSKLSDQAISLLKKHQFNITRHDLIEHHFLKNVINQLVHVRASNLLRIL